MKKIFTLFAVAAMALTAGAQEKALFDYSTKYQDGQAISTASARLTLGNDMKEWKTGAAKISPESYLSEFGQTVTVTTDNGDVEQFSAVTVTGSNNPKDQAESGKGSGINCAEGKTTARLPQNGSYFIFTPTVSGKVQAGIVLNVDKPLYLLDATDAVATDDGYLEIALPAANLHNYVLKDAEGNEVALAEAGDGKGGMVVSDKLTGTLEFDAEAGKTYYFFCSGSKLGCFGYIFTPSGEAPNLVEVATLWEGEALVTGWANQPTFLSDGGPELKNAGAEVGDVVRFYMSAPDREWQCELTEGHWGGMYVRWAEYDHGDTNEDGSVREYTVVDLANKGYADFVLTEEVLENAYTVKYWGGVFLLNGDGNITVTKLVLCKKDGTIVPPPVEEKESIIDKFTGNWNGEETNTHNADGSVTYNGKQWGGLSAWLCDENDTPSDWSAYTKLVFEFAEPTPAACQGFIQTTTEDITYWGVAGIVKLECPFEGKDMSQVKQAALQAAEDATYQISAIYLVKNADPEGIEERVYVTGFDANAPVYNLAGMRVGKDYKGIVIQNGRKFILK